MNRTELLRAIYLDLADDPEHGHEGWELDGRHTSYGTWRVPTDPVELVYFAVFDPNLVRRKQKEEPMKAHPHAENSKPNTWIDEYAQLIDDWSAGNPASPTAGSANSSTASAPASLRRSRSR